MIGDRPAILIELERRRQEAIRRAFTRLHAVGFGAGFGALGALGLFLATAILLLKGPETPGGEVGSHLWLLSGWLPGFGVTWGGACIGALWGFVLGFLVGFVVASARNFSLRFVLWKADFDQRRWRNRHLLDEI
jgi:hypothetical protein